MENRSNSATPDRIFFRLFWISLAVKLVLSAWIPLVADEKYYWVWSHHLQLSYYDHPPIIAWLIKAGHLLSGLGHAVRWPAVILAHFQIFFWYKIVGPYLSSEKTKLWLLVLLLNPLTGMGALIVTPDLPMMFFWSACCYFFVRYLERGKTADALGLGISLGLGFCSKYQIVLFPLSVFLWMAFNRKEARLKLKDLLLVVLAGFVFSLPVFIWNYRHDFDSFLFQMRHGLGAPKYDPEWTLSYVGALILLLSPPILIEAFRKSSPKTPSWLPWLAWTPIVFFFLSTFRGRPEANWPMAAYPAAFSLALIRARALKPLRWTIAFWAVCGAIVVSLVEVPWAPELIKKSKLAEWNEFDVIEPVLKDHQPVYFGSYQMAASISYLTGKVQYKLKNMGRRDFYDYLENSAPTASRFWLVMRTSDEVPHASVENYHGYERGLVGDHFRLLEFVRK